MLASLNRSMLDVYRKPAGGDRRDWRRVGRCRSSPDRRANRQLQRVCPRRSDHRGWRRTYYPENRARHDRGHSRARLSEATRFDVVFSTGGVSAGDFDHVKGVMDELGMRVLFHGVAQRPGRPLKFGIMAERPVFGLPGNPVSTMVCFYLYARPALRKMGGFRKLGAASLQGRLRAADIKVATNLTEFVRVRLERKDGEIYANPTGNQGSGILSSLVSRRCAV